MNEKPLLSICIPTYNRAEYIAKSLDSLVNQPDFSQVEITISDNASSDNTEEICKQYCEKYPNISYYKNQENINDMNFPLALIRAKGVYRKLLNDTAIYENDFLSYLLGIIRSYSDERPFLFFLNGARPCKKIPAIAECTDFSDFCMIAGRWLTWIGSIGLWEDDCIGLESEYPICETKLWQTYKSLKTVSEQKKVLLLQKRILTTQTVQKKDFSYGIYNVFYKTFPSFLEQYKNSGQLTEKAFKKIRKEMLFSQAAGFFFRIPKVFREKNLGKEVDYKKLILQDYRKEPYFIYFFVWNFFYNIWLNIKPTWIGKKLLKIKRKIGQKLN